MAFPTDEDGFIEVGWIDPSSADYGGGQVSSITLNETDGTEYSEYRASYASGDPDPNTWGFGLNSTPQMGDGDPLAPHGVFPTDFYEYFIGGNTLAL